MNFKVISLGSILLLSCRTNSASNVKDEVVKGADGKISLLYAPKGDNASVCVSECSEDPVQAIRSQRFDICGSNGKSLSAANAQNIVGAFITAKGGTDNDAKRIIETIQKAPQGTSDDTSEKRPEGFMIAISALANYMKTEGKVDPRCNADQHLKEYPIGSLINKATPQVSKIEAEAPPKPAAPASTAPKKVEYHAVCGWSYSGWFSSKVGLFKADTTQEAQEGAADACRQYATKGYEKYCYDRGCDLVTVDFIEGSFWEDRFTEHKIAHRRKSDGQYCDEFGVRLATERPPEYRAPCFTAGTLIATPSGDRAIESLQIGDEVLAYDFTNQKVVRDVISYTSEKIGSELVLMTLDNGTTLEVTPDHPFYDQESGLWIYADQVKTGTTLLNLQKSPANLVKVVSVLERRITTSEQSVFNLTTENHHNYFAGGVLVHNY